MSRVEFEPKIPVFEWGKTFHVLDRAATVIGSAMYEDEIHSCCISLNMRHDEMLGVWRVS
jgi:hypothetical protein